VTVSALLELVEVSKNFRSDWTFRSFRALESLSLGVREGEVLGLIGHNGAGKTTTLKLIVGLLRPTRGCILWEGQGLHWGSPRREIGFSPEAPYFHDYLTVRETLVYYAQLYGLAGSERKRRIDEVVERLRIGHKLQARMRSLSKGTLQRVAVAQAILHAPRLAILDEPMSGLDPSGRKEMRDLIRSLKEGGTSVLFSSHILTDAETLCDRVAILGRGKLQEVVDLSAQTQTPASYALAVRGVSNGVLETLRRMAAEPVQGGPQHWRIVLRDEAGVRAALDVLHGSDMFVESLTPMRPSLEQRFLRYVQHAAGND
jgi:ABC-2 type transport system ATP-binding protein